MGEHLTTSQRSAPGSIIYFQLGLPENLEQDLNVPELRSLQREIENCKVYVPWQCNTQLARFHSRLVDLYTIYTKLTMLYILDTLKYRND